MKDKRLEFAVLFGRGYIKPPETAGFDVAGALGMACLAVVGLASVLLFVGDVGLTDALVTGGGTALAMAGAAGVPGSGEGGGDGTGGDGGDGDPPPAGKTVGLSQIKGMFSELMDKNRDEILGKMKETSEANDARFTAIEEKIPDPADPRFAPRLPKGESAGEGTEGAPAVITNMTKMSELYSFQRIARAVTERDLSICKTEVEISGRLEKLGYKREGPGVLVPVDPHQVTYVADAMGHDGAAFKDVVEMMSLPKSALTPSVAKALAKGNHTVNQRLTKQQQVFGDDTLGGALVDTVLAGTVIELMRAKEVLVAAGATTIPLPPSGQLSWAKETGDPTWNYVGENKSISASTATYGNILFVAKKAGALVKLSNESIRFTNPSIEALIRNALAESGARFKDKQFLQDDGSGTGPKGIITFGGIDTRNASTQKANGDTFEAEDPALALADLETNNFEPTAFIMRPGLWWRLVNRRGDAVSAGDKSGDFLHMLTRISDSAPVSGILGLPALRTSAVSASRTKASGTTNTYVLAGDFSKAIIGESAVMEISASNQADTAFANDQTWLRATMHHDFQLTHEDAFLLIDNIKEDA